MDVKHDRAGRYIVLRSRRSSERFHLMLNDNVLLLLIPDECHDPVGHWWMKAEAIGFDLEPRRDSIMHQMETSANCPGLLPMPVMSWPRALVGDR